MIQKHGNPLDFSADRWPPVPDKPTLVFIHGAATNRIFWDAQITGLSHMANTVALDLPGHGTSPPPGRDTIEGYANSVLEFIENMEIPNPVPCGLSMGGAIVQYLLIHDNGRFPAGIVMNSGARLKVMPQIFELLERDYRDFLQMLSTFAVSMNSGAKILENKKLRKKIETACICTTKVALEDFHACNNFDAMGELNLIKVPVLVVSGENDNITPLKYGNFLAQHIPLARHQIISDVGHLSPLESPNQVNRVIHHFLLECFTSGPLTNHLL